MSFTVSGPATWPSPGASNRSQQFTTTNHNGTQQLSGVQATAPHWIHSDLYFTLISPMLTAELKQKGGIHSVNLCTAKHSSNAVSPNPKVILGGVE